MSIFPEYYNVLSFEEVNKHKKHRKKLYEANGLKILQCFDCDVVMVLDEVSNKPE
jgi:hypothetical protein